MDFLPEVIENYVIENSEKEPRYLNQLNRETNLKILNPRMLSGHIQGRILSMLSNMIRPKRILEIGTYTGYSALCLAEGLTRGGILYTIDINEELEPIIKKYFSASDYANQIQLKIGNALDIVAELDETFDLVFIDADKENYSNYFDMVIDKVRQGGYIIADNVLWSGKVTEPINEDDIDTKSLIDYSKKVNNDLRVTSVLFPVRDGLMISRKL